MCQPNGSSETRERLFHERLPQGEEERKCYANQVGADGWVLLRALSSPTTPDWMKTLPAKTELSSIWEQQFEAFEQGDNGEQSPLCRRLNSSIPPMTLMPVTGGKARHPGLVTSVHFTQTCDEAPQLIASVETTRAGINDDKALASIHAHLACRDLLPNQHLVDAGYVDAVNLLQSRDDYEVDLVGPVRQN